MQSKTPHISGTFAIPASIEDLMPEEETTGLENIVDWDDLEDELLAGNFASKERVREYLQVQFDTHNEAQPEGTEPVVFNRHQLRSVLDGLCNLPVDTPRTMENAKQWHAMEVRAAYDSLPDRSAINRHQAVEIRQRNANGETITALALHFGVSRQTVSDVVNNLTWKDAA